MKTKPVLQGAGIATLFIAPFAVGFLTPTLGDAYHRIHPLTSIYRAILVAILLVWLAGTLGFLLLKRLPERWRRTLWLIPLILLPWLFFRGMTGALANSPYLALLALRVGRFLTQAVAIVSVIVLLFRSPMLDRYIAGARLFYAICGFGVFVLVPQLGYHALSPERREASSFERANLPPVSPSAVLIVSLPEGVAHMVAEPASALAVHRILDSLMRDQMRTTADIEDLVGKLPQENAAPENAVQENAEETSDEQTHN